MFNTYDNFSLPDINQQMLEVWRREDLFHRSLEASKGHPSFVFYEGPPSANGMPGIHHVLARTIKDTFCRYKTMQGYEVKRKAGWDTHGLPVELGVEKSLGISKEDIGRKISVDDYNAACRREVMKYTEEWSRLTDEMGYWVDLEHPYVTYHNSYIETVWWLLAQLYKKGYLYKGYTIQPYSPAAGTGLSSHELNQPGCYRDVKDTTATAIFEIIDATREMQGWGKACLVAWTTTPWTLPSNTALCVGPKIQYVAVQTYNPYTAEPLTMIIAEPRLSAYLKPEGAEAPMQGYKAGDKLVPYRIVAHYTGADLVGMRYRQLMPWVKPTEKVSELSPAWVSEYAANHPEKMYEVSGDRFVEIADRAFRVIPGDYVTTDDGTGIVHIAPTFGADDAKVARQAGVPALYMINRHGETRPMVDLQGKYYPLDQLAEAFVERCVDVPLYSQHAGEYVKPQYNMWFNKGVTEAEDLNVTLSVEMKRQGQALRVEKHVHNYPHCWRTDQPVLYYPLDSWFIRTTAARDRLMQLNEGIKWKPTATGTGRFGKWLENLQDWNLSRSRYWGTPLPIWRTADGKEEICIDSIATLYKEIDRAVEAGVMKSNPYRDQGFVPGDYTEANYQRIDLHRPYVDDIVLVSPTGREMHREADLIDVWFDSGSMPYAQAHYPFENKEALDSGEVYPADFIAEGVDQTRGWFFTLHAIAGMIFDSVAYKAVVSNGLVLDKDGNKMSKRLGNAVNPFEAIASLGSDPLRWYMMANSSPWENLKFDAEGVRETSRKMFATLHNTYSFFALYANVDGFDIEAAQVPLSQRPEIDRWIISLLNSLVADVTEALDDYEPTKAARAIAAFISDHLSNWYVRLNRKRFWGTSMTQDKLSAYQTLYQCLLTLSQLMAPIAPFMADRLYRDLRQEADRSVHLSSWPKADAAAIDKALEQRMALAQDITSMTLALRRKVNIKVRQPLQTLMIPAGDEASRQALEAIRDLVLGEVNIKEMRLVSDDEGVMVRRVKPDFKRLGPKHGRQMKAVAAALTSLTQPQINQLARDGQLTIALPDGSQATVSADDVEIISQDIPGWVVANDGALTVALDINVTDELRREGIARDIINRVQNIRKSRQYNITDKITLAFAPTEGLQEVIQQFGPYIGRQVLATSVVVDPTLGKDTEGIEALELDDITLHCLINPAQNG